MRRHARSGTSSLGTHGLAAANISVRSVCTVNQNRQRRLLINSKRQWCLPCLADIGVGYGDRIDPLLQCDVTA